MRCVAYVRDPQVPAKQQGYVDVQSVRTDKSIARDVLTTEFARAGQALARARELARVFELQDEVEKHIKGVADLRQRITEDTQAEGHA